MCWPRNLAVRVLITVFLGLCSSPLQVSAAPPEAGDRLTRVRMSLRTAQGKGVKEVEIELLVNGQHVNPARAGMSVSKPAVRGLCGGRYRLPQGTLPEAAVKIRALRAELADSGVGGPSRLLGAGTDTAGNRLFQVQADLTLKRQITPAFWIASLVLLLVYMIIASELMHRTLAALLGAALILFITYTAGTFDKSFFILSFEDAMGAMDLNVIFLLHGHDDLRGGHEKDRHVPVAGLQVLCPGPGQRLCPVLHPAIPHRHYLGLPGQRHHHAAGDPGDHRDRRDPEDPPLTFLIPQTFASNVGGTATLIGDPPNILIGSYASLTFGQFVTNLPLICFLCQIVSCFYFLWWHKKEYLKAGRQGRGAHHRVL